MDISNNARFWQKTTILFAFLTVLVAVIAIIFKLTINTQQDTIAMQDEYIATQQEQYDLLAQKIEILEGLMDESENEGTTGEESEDLMKTQYEEVYFAEFA